jgi:hypothetical protein
VSRLQYMWRAKVTGNSAFPVDMLRYDQCWPLDPSPVTQSFREDGSRTGKLTVQIQGVGSLTPDRWASFGWYVSDIET